MLPVVLPSCVRTSKRFVISPRRLDGVRRLPEPVVSGRLGLRRVGAGDQAVRDVLNAPMSLSEIINERGEKLIIGLLLFLVAGFSSFLWHGQRRGVVKKGVFARAIAVSVKPYVDFMLALR